jgi:Uma2 family endonuclease
MESLPLMMDAPRKKWPRADCDAMESIGLLQDDRLELVDGELIRMIKARPHCNAQRTLFLWLLKVPGPDFVIENEPIDVLREDNPRNEPVPDIAVLNRSFEEFPVNNPGPADLRLIVEVASVSLYLDLNSKSSIYARAGRRLIVHRRPESGAYLEVTVYAANEFVSPLAAPDARFRVGDAFPGAN